ncbi:MAG: VWA domain-containing protein [Bacteroidia bacterium]
MQTFKKRIKQIVFVVMVLMVCKGANANQKTASIDLVFCLDLSGSTNGLIDDVRDNIWDIINQCYSYRPQPDFRVGIVAFSRPSFGRENGYVKILCPLTNNFEFIAFEMAKLKPSIEKGDQLVGHALKAATLGMQWTTRADAIKVIFLVGNGLVNLDGEKYREAYAYAAANKIIVNTVYCKSSNYIKEISGWREIAKSTGGIPYDMQIHKRNPLILTCKEKDSLHYLGKSFFETYIYYGEKGKDFYKMEQLIDKTALMGNEMTYQSRLFYKVSDLFQLKQAQWDLVDYLKATNSDFTEIYADQLPDTLQSYTSEKLRQLIMSKKDQRLKLISQIRGFLKFDRQQIINKQIAEKAYDKNPGTFDRIVISWLNKAAAEKGLNTFAN